MVDAPERIWAKLDRATVYMDGSSPLTASTREFTHSIEYVRADLVSDHSRETADLRRQVEELRADLADQVNIGIRAESRRCAETSRAEKAEAKRDEARAYLERKVNEKAELAKALRAVEIARDALVARVEGLEADLKKQIRRATDAEYMGVAYRNMLGPIGVKVAEMWMVKGVKRVHFDWSSEAWEMGGEDRAQCILDWEYAPRLEVTPGEIED